MKNKKAALTLIELLVVVLIIGILSAIALPQYEKVVLKAKAQNLRILTNSVAQAYQNYFDLNGEWPTSIDAIDIDIDGVLPYKLSEGAILVGDDWQSIKDGRKNDDFQIVITYNHRYGYLTVGQYLKGSYKYSGFIFIHETGGVAKQYRKKLLCMSEKTYTNATFCEKILNTSTPLNTSYYYQKLFEM